MFDNPMEISCQKTQELLSGGDPPLLIDCREQNEFDFCRIEGAILIPLSSFGGRAEALFQHVEQKAIVYCHHGVRSLHAAEYLHQKGFTNVLSMRGGIDVWSSVVDNTVERY